MKSFINFRLLSKHHDGSQPLLITGCRQPDNYHQFLPTSWSCLLHNLLISAQTRSLLVISLPDTNHNHLNSLLGVTPHWSPKILLTIVPHPGSDCFLVQKTGSDEQILPSILLVEENFILFFTPMEGS